MKTILSKNRLFILPSLVWLALITITLSTLWVESIFENGWVYAILAMAGLKYLAIGSQFMEAKKAHPFWPVWLGIIFLTFATGVLYFNPS